MRAWWLVVVAACGSSPPPGPGAGAGPAPASPPLDAAPALVVVDAAPPVAMACTAGAPRGDWNPYDQRRAVDATDGVHVDACDAAGDLISYQCELRDLACPGGRGHSRHAVAPCYEQTGAVTEERIACDGRCRDGACASRCPQFGDALTFAAVSSTGVVFTSAADARRIACTLGFDQRDAYDCAADPRVGDPFVVEGLGMSTSTCTGGVWGAISDARCTWTGCHYVD